MDAVHAREAKRSGTWSHELSHTFSKQFLAARLAGSRAPSPRVVPPNKIPAGKKCSPRSKGKQRPARTSKILNLKKRNCQWACQWQLWTQRFALRRAVPVAGVWGRRYANDVVEDTPEWGRQRRFSSKGGIGSAGGLPSSIGCLDGEEQGVQGGGGGERQGGSRRDLNRIGCRGKHRCSSPYGGSSRGR